MIVNHTVMHTAQIVQTRSSANLIKTLENNLEMRCNNQIVQFVWGLLCQIIQPL